MTRNDVNGDFAAFAIQEYASGRIDRRLLLQVLTGAVAVTMLGPDRVRAETKEFVLSTFGGWLAEAIKTEFAEPFAEATGLAVKEDPSGPLAGRIRAMVEARRVIWDVCDSVSFTAIALGKLGLLEPIDYSVVDKSLVTPDCILKHGVNYGWYGVGFAYDKEKFGDNPPKGWADVFNTTDFPGNRVMWKYGYCWEAALLADGVAPDKLYPLDVDRAVAKFLSIKNDSIYLESDTASALRDGEASVGILFSHEAARVNRQTDGRIVFSWNQALKGPTTFIVPKGNPAGRDLAMRFIASALRADRQAAAVKKSLTGSANPAVFATLPPEVQQWDPNNPAWAKDQIRWNDAYYADNEERLIGVFLDKVAG
jgi:putative spermidine/putrescine transport system substrate-binding protein